MDKEDHQVPHLEFKISFWWLPVFQYWVLEWILIMIWYPDEIKHHKPRMLNGQPQSFINLRTAHVMWLTSRDHSLPASNEPSRQCIHLSRAEIVQRTPVWSFTFKSSSFLFYSVSNIIATKSVIEFVVLPFILHFSPLVCILSPWFTHERHWNTLLHLWRLN